MTGLYILGGMLLFGAFKFLRGDYVIRRRSGWKARSRR